MCPKEVLHALESIQAFYTYEREHCILRDAYAKWSQVLIDPQMKDDLHASVRELDSVYPVQMALYNRHAKLVLEYIHHQVQKGSDVWMIVEDLNPFELQVQCVGTLGPLLQGLDHKKFVRYRPLSHPEALIEMFKRDTYLNEFSECFGGPFWDLN